MDKGEFFREATLRICGTLDIDKALDQFIHYLKEFMPINDLGLILFEPGTRLLRTIAQANLSGRIPGAYKDVVVQLTPAEGAHVATTEIRIFEDSATDVVSQRFAEYWQIHNISLMVMPLNIDKTRVGAVSLRAKGKGRYTQAHADLLALLDRPFCIAMSNAITHKELLDLKNRLADENQYLRTRLNHLSQTDIICKSAGIKKVMDMVRRVSPLECPVLLLGETGVGKDVIARAIHDFSPRKESPFVKVNCGAITPTLIDSELFGHEKGSFTGAIATKKGHFERADNGTIFLDEIGELPLDAQIHLLHVLQNGEFQRVGGSKLIRANVRVVAATHRNLEEMIQTQRFREDLWFRINVFPIKIPPLRERKEDIPVLLHHFIGRKAQELGLDKSPVVPSEEMDYLKRYRWPGNVRELVNVVERALILQCDGVLDFHSLLPQGYGPAWKEAPNSDSLPLTLDQVEKEHIDRILKMTNGKIHGHHGAAELLGINGNTLRNRMDRLGITYKQRTLRPKQFEP